MADRAPTTQSGRIGAKFCDGDPEATEQVRVRVRRTLAFRGYGIPPEERRDLEQIVMTQLWEATGKPDFDPAAGFWSFVELVAARRCIDWRRTRREEVPFEPEHASPDPAETPLNSTLLRERRALARDTLDQLPDGCRELIRLHLGQGMSYAEVAKVLGVREGALRVRMHRCVQRARNILRGLTTLESGSDEV